MLKLTNELITSNYTEILHEKEFDHVPNNFIINKVDYEYNGSPTLAIINFQNGLIKDNGINGISNEDLIAIVIKRLECIQNTKLKSSENALALIKLEECLMALKKYNK